MWKYGRMMLVVYRLSFVFWGVLAWELTWGLCNDYKIRFAKGKESHQPQLP